MVRQMEVILSAKEPLTSETPCTCPHTVGHALAIRQRLVPEVCGEKEHIHHFDGCAECVGRAIPVGGSFTVPATLPRPYQPRERAMRGFEHCLRVLYQMLGRHHVQHYTRQDCLERFTGAKRAHYEKGLHDLEENGLGNTFFDVAGKWGETSRRPRAIIPQMSYLSDGSKSFVPILVELPYRRRQEAQMIRLTREQEVVNFACGFSLTVRAEWIVKTMGKFKYVLSFDMKSFDGSLFALSRAELRQLLSVYGRDGDLTKVIRAQMKGEIRSRDIKATIGSNRASGTAGTSVGNKIVAMTAFMYALGRTFRNKECSILSDGDDTLVACNTLEHLPSWLRRLRSLGLETKLENVAVTPEEVLFCRSRPVKLSTGWTMVKDPAAALKNVFCVRRYFRATERQFRSYLAALNGGYKTLWAGVPILGEIHRLYPERDGSEAKIVLGNSGMEYVMQHETMRTSVVTDESRASFARAFGILPAQQVEAERLLKEAASKYTEALVSGAKGIVRATPDNPWPSAGCGY